MRAMFLPTLAVAGLLSLPALAEDSARPHEPKVQCSIHAKDGSRAVQGKDLIVNAGEKINTRSPLTATSSSARAPWWRTSSPSGARSPLKRALG